uniref:SSD domain-containing protein n=1 Tax=Meloidogyne hapla TaxID=6305 RepID=A0A1I8BRH1_MELHA
MGPIRCFFHFCGSSISRWPFFFGLISLVVVIILSTGMIWIKIKDRIRDGYTPENSPSRLENDAMRRFWNSFGDPMKAQLMIRSKVAEQNMLSSQHLSETIKLMNYLIWEFKCYQNEKNNQNLTKTFTYSDICSPYCEFNFGLELFVDSLTQTIDSFKEENKNKIQNLNKNLSFPISKIHSIDIHLELFFFGVKLRENEEINKTLEQKITNMESIEMVLIRFQSARSNPERARQLIIWELGVFNYLQNKFENDIIDAQIIGVEILESEMTRDHQDNVKYFALGLLAISIFVVINVFCTSAILGNLDFGKTFIAFATILCPMLAIVSTFGILSIFGIRINSFLLILPYLILGIGVDDGFLLMLRWFQLAKHINEPKKRLKIVIKEMGPSITVTTLTNVISFGVGAFTPTPEIRLFCFGTAIALTFDYTLQLTLFCPIMLFSSKFENSNKNSSNQPKVDLIVSENKMSAIIKKRKYSPFEVNNEKKMNGWIYKKLNKLIKLYCKLLNTRCFCLISILCLLFYLYLAIMGSLHINSKLDLNKILPRDSKMRESTLLLEQKVWSNHLPFTVIVEGPLNISSNEQMTRFWAMIDEFESMPNSKGEDDNNERINNFINELGIDGMEGLNVIKDVDFQSKEINLCRLGQFLDLPFYSHWNASIKLQNISSNNCPILSAFTLSFAYYNVSNWQIRIELMQQWRSIASRHSKNLNLSVWIWEENSLFVDQMLSLGSTTFQSFVLTLICMSLVCLLFMPSLFSVLIASASICSISIGVFGFLSCFGFDLDPVTMAATLMSIGLSVDFISHVIYHFRQDVCYKFRKCSSSPTGFIEQCIPLTNKIDKLKYTLESVGWPMLQAGISTILCILPLALINKYSPTVFVYAVIFVCSLGLLHGLVLLPCLLCHLPIWCNTQQNKFFGFFSNFGKFQVYELDMSTFEEKRTKE